MFFVHNRLFLLTFLNELKLSNNWFFWKKLIEEEKVGNPVRYFLYPKAVEINFQTYHLKKYNIEFLQKNLIILMQCLNLVEVMEILHILFTKLIKIVITLFLTRQR